MGEHALLRQNVKVVPVVVARGVEAINLQQEDGAGFL
jgi:hypothetical protein